MSRPPAKCAVVALFALLGAARAAELQVGCATVDITPDQPVGLDGFRGMRVSKDPATPMTATALALESRDGVTSIDAAIIVSCDIIAIRPGIQARVREKVRSRLPDFDLSKIFLCATHTHSGPVTEDDKYALPETGVMKPSAYADFMTGRIADAIVESWKRRAPGKAGWGQGQAVIAQNRRAVYADGDYGVQMKGRSPAVQTFVIQLACDTGGYLASERAVRGGGYGAVIQSNRIGPEGGQILVNRSVEAMQELWKD